MKPVTVDCPTGRATSRTMTEEEEQRRLADAALFKAGQKERLRDGLRGRLLGAMADLEHAKALEVEGVLDAADVAVYQATVDDLKAKL